MLKEEILERAISEAQKDARKNGLQIGNSIAHPDDDFIYTLKEIRGDKAIGIIPAQKSATKKEIIKEFPLNEIFDPNVAIRLALEEKLGSVPGVKTTFM